jgi:hypothetical protein
VAGGRLGDAVAGCAATAGRAQHPAEPFGVTQVDAGVRPIQPGDPGQRLAGSGRQAFLLVQFPAVRLAEDRSRVVQSAGELGELQAVGLGEPGDVVEKVLADHGSDGARQWARRQGFGPVAEPGQAGRVEGHRVLLARRVADSAA